MTLKKGTIAAQIRDKIDLMHALIVSGKKDGGEFSYGEVLVLAGLPSNHSYVRELSNQLIARGYRRHAAKQPKPAPVPTEEMLPGIEDVIAPERDPILAALADSGKLNEIARALNQMSEGMRAVAEAVGLHVWTETVYTNHPGTASDE